MADLVRTEPASARAAAEALAEPAPELLEPAAHPEVLEGSLIVRAGRQLVERAEPEG